MCPTFAVRETQSLGQQMLNAPFGINGLRHDYIQNIFPRKHFSVCNVIMIGFANSIQLSNGIPCIVDATHALKIQCFIKLKQKNEYKNIHGPHQCWMRGTEENMTNSAICCAGHMPTYIVNWSVSTRCFDQLMITRSLSSTNYCTDICQFKKDWNSIDEICIKTYFCVP